jgi:transcriptional regulator with XRE-family HTH domain
MSKKLDAASGRNWLPFRCVLFAHSGKVPDLLGPCKPFLTFFFPHTVCVPRKNPLPRRQIEIGQRFKALRKSRRWSRADMQYLAGIDADTCRNVEEGRAPLRYNTAAEFVMFAKASALWLATGEGRQDSHIGLPSLKSLGLHEDSLFVDVFDLRIRPRWVSGIGEDTQRGHTVRWSHLNNLAAWLRNVWLPCVPESELMDFSDKLRVAADAAIRQYPQVSPDEVLERRTALAALDADYEAKKILTAVTSQRNIPAVKSPLARLIDRVRAATRPKGMKADLAKSLNVPAPRVSEWLRPTDPVIPSGETTLRLLQWVERQERQQNKGSGSMSVPSEPKTQLKGSNEKKPQSGRKKQ